MKTKLTEDQIRLLKSVVDHFDKEDQSVRDRQIRTWKRLKLLWDGFTRIYYSEVAHDWRIDNQASSNNSDQEYYDKTINVFRAYLESIIAALSVLVPPIECYPDNAEDPLDLLTARTGNKIAELIYRHNDVPLLWLHALFIFCTEGMVACHNYSKKDKKYGTYKDDKYESFIENHEYSTCPNCNEQLNDQVVQDDSVTEETEECINCNQTVVPNRRRESIQSQRLISSEDKPKSRQKLCAYGGLYVKIPLYAKEQSDCLYLIYSCETHYAAARAQYPDIRDKIGPQGANDTYDRWGRLSLQYRGEYPETNVTIRETWLRPAAFEILSEDDCDELKKLFPDGVKVCLVNDTFALAEVQLLDDHWTLTYNPLSDYLQHDPLGLLLTSVQEITGDIISLVLQTMEHGIPQTFVDPTVLDFNAYRQVESAPGMIFPVTPKSGRQLGESFYEVRTASLSAEVLPFQNTIQSLAQLASGALPSLFGGQLEGSKTASEYSMSRAQALQRQQNTWKIFIIWWKTIFSKVIPAYIADVKEDERYTQKDGTGNYVNVYIRKSELEGRIGQIELEANENLPMTWMQRKDVIMQLIQANNPQILQALAAPENLSIIREAIGLTDFIIPGEDDKDKQYDEIKLLLNSDPITIQVDEQAVIAAVSAGQPPPTDQEEPSIEADQYFDNHLIHFEICRKFVVSDAGRQAKTENEAGYKNVLLHAMQHQRFIQMAMMAQAAQGAEQQGQPNSLNTKEAPIIGESDVTAQ